ncbi:MAG: CoA-acylating methylmalonate-semialdehyde dehydrogenase [Actinobacteria bacterium]|nr:CoA-acylating methylmalonate-semialdehyde dehydrogenase [Actinomycetota bacterium]
MIATAPKLRHAIGGAWVESDSAETLDVLNPATGQPVAKVPLATPAEVDAAVEAAQAAFPAWRAVPAVERARLLLRLHGLLFAHVEELARTVTIENGKTLDEARGEVLRTIENLEVAAGIPSLMQGVMSEDIARGIDETAIRQPLGVFAVVAPFNFPAMVPWWFAPYAVATGNTFIVKPSQQTPLSQVRILELVAAAGFPAGVFNLVHGARDQVERLCAHPLVRGISFVGSTPVAQHVYAAATAHGKRAQCQGGAKNFLVVMPDAQFDAAIPNICGSTYGCAGERCLAGSALVAVGDAYDELKERMVRASRGIKVGNGLDPATGMGPVISKRHLARVLSYIEQGLAAGAQLIVDGRGVQVEGHPDGNWIGPTIFDGVTPDMTIAQEEIFGPVVSLLRVSTLNEALELIEASPYGNAASIYTSSGGAAREFCSRVAAGNVGVNVGVAAPMAFFPFGGRKASFYGDLHGQGRDAVSFFTDQKVVIARWPRRTDGRDPWD